MMLEPCGVHAKGIITCKLPIDRFHVTLLRAFKPLIQVRLSHRRHHLFHILLLHHAFIPHKLFHRTGWNGGNGGKDFSGNKLLKGLGNVVCIKILDDKKLLESRTVIRTSLVQRTMPILLPPIWTGADCDVRTCF